MSQRPSQPDGPQPAEDLREELVAYLDGELGPKEAAQVEELLVRDPVARTELQRLEETWDMLDALERPTVDEAFTHSTLDIVAQSAEEEYEQVKRTAPRRLAVHWTVGVALVVLAACAGYFGLAAALPDPNRQVLADLPIIENLDALRHVESLEFIRRLQAAGLFTDEENWSANTSPASEPTATAPAEPAPDSDDMELRRRWLESLDNRQQHLLRRNIQRFQALPASEQDRLRDMYAEIQAAPDRGELEKTIRRYYEWYKLLNVYQRMDLQRYAGSERIERIRRLREEMVLASFAGIDSRRIRWLLEMLAQQSGARPSAEDIHTLIRWVEDFAMERGDQVREHLPSEDRRKVERFLQNVDDDMHRREMLAMTWLKWQAENPDDRSILTDADLGRLRERLSAESRATLSSLSPSEQVKIITNWLRVFVFHRFMARRGPGDWRHTPDETELFDFMEEELTEEERDELLRMPTNEMYRELMNRYIAWRYPWSKTKLPKWGEEPSRGGPRAAGDNGRRPAPWTGGGSGDFRRPSGPPDRERQLNDSREKDESPPEPLPDATDRRTSRCDRRSDCPSAS